MKATSEPSYSAFGLTVRSDLDLPELPRQDGPANEPTDVTVTVGGVNRPGLAAATNGTVEHAGPTEYYLTYELVDVAVRDGREIVVDPKGDVPREILRHVVLGPAFNHLLHQRGHFVLHASVVEVDGTAVAFLGDSGQGKTTTAMAFLLEGHRVLSDDVATIVSGDTGPAVRGGYPAIKLDPAVVERFDVPVGEPQGISDARERHFYPLPYEQPSEPVSLARVYVLEDANRLEITGMRPKTGIMKLIENTYTTGLLSDDATAVSNFDRCADLASAVPVKHLRRPRDLNGLSRLVNQVIDDLDAPC
ncbi:hypothetical protein [Halorubrum sp. N11]|uniref:hypothetical protein n=1 Tax=Halorubrum sp. N11 TaxID=3402276 RepID=UPI003EBD34F9